jgi:hypothetical protein
LTGSLASSASGAGISGAACALAASAMPPAANPKASFRKWRRSIASPSPSEFGENESFELAK